MAVRPPPRPRTLPPSPTVYIRNLEERVKLDDLDSALRTIFSQFGTVLDVVIKGSINRKGQAFVVFDNVESATRAVEETQGFPLWNKPIVVEFARSPSDAFVEATDASSMEQHKRARLAEKGEQVQSNERTKANQVRETERKQAIEASSSALKRPAPPPAVGDQKPAKLRGAGLKSTGGVAAVIPDEYLPPNKTLFIQNLPEDYNDIDKLTQIFGGFEGFREVRLVPGRKGIAFVEYETEQGSIEAKQQMAGNELDGQAIKVTFQRQ